MALLRGDDPRANVSTAAEAEETASPLARSPRPLVFAHRGASREAPENTLAAFQLAERMGADGVELDVQRCASGEVVVVHDESLGRTTGYPALLAETPWSVVRTLDAGARKGAHWAGERVPLLEGVLAQTPRTLLVNIELKCSELDDRGLVAEVVRIVRDAGAEGRVLLSSFNPVCLLRARSLSPHLPRALLFEKDAPFLLRHALSARPLGVCALHPQASLASPSALAAWRRRGYSVTPWTVNDPELAVSLWSAGATGLITDVPDQLLARFASR